MEVYVSTDRWYQPTRQHRVITLEQLNMHLHGCENLKRCAQPQPTWQLWELTNSSRVVAGLRNAQFRIPVLLHTLCHSITCSIRLSFVSAIDLGW
jgi:hypothetical protein